MMMWMVASLLLCECCACYMCPDAGGARPYARRTGERIPHLPFQASSASADCQERFACWSPCVLRHGANFLQAVGVMCCRGPLKRVIRKKQLCLNGFRVCRVFDWTSQGFTKLDFPDVREVSTTSGRGLQQPLSTQHVPRMLQIGVDGRQARVYIFQMQAYVKPSIQIPLQRAGLRRRHATTTCSKPPKTPTTSASRA